MIYSTIVLKVFKKALGFSKKIHKEIFIIKSHVLHLLTILCWLFL